MLIRVFTLKFHPVTEQFDDDALQDFIKDKELLRIREHFFMKQETPYLVVFLTYRPGSRDLEHAAGKQKADAWRELLTDDQVPLFNTLRDWRTEQAKREGVPPYIICTNQQLAQIVAARPDTLAGLCNVQGFGKAKADKYGQELLALLRPAEAKPEASPPKPAEQPVQAGLFSEKPQTQETR